jgi:hypothetical protein
MEPHNPPRERFGPLDQIGKSRCAGFVALYSKERTFLGIIYRQAKMLLDAHQSGVQMNHLLMIGHQSLLLHPSELQAVRKVCPGALTNYKWGEYADRFFRECLNVSKVNTLDYSSYEGADILHDLSHPIPNSLKGRFDAVIEAGTLEHVFNFPTAIANLMQMTKLGGSIFASTVSNNLCGHGFYQFSPELIFRVFTADNGFQMGKVLAQEARYPGVELTPIRNAYEVADPARIGGRVGLVTKRPVMLFFVARKTAELPIFVNSPMQSDYVAVWDLEEKPVRSRMPQWIRNLPLYISLRTWLFRTSILQSLRNWLTGRRQLKQCSLNNKRVFRKV